MVAYSFKQRFVQPIRVGLSSVSLSFDCAPKRQTIRLPRRRHARPGEILQLYYAQRTKHCQKIGEARCIEVVPIRINVSPTPYGLDIRVGKHWLSDLERIDFAQADGFNDCGDMYDFWRQEHGVGYFNGDLIKWEPI